jgi:hypothetical protein
MPGVTVSAAAELLRHSGGRPDVVRAHARVASRDAAVLLEGAIDWCALTVRAYADGAPLPGAPAWSSAVSPMGPGESWTCSHVLRGVTLLPGDTVDFDASFETRWILGSDLPEGRYRLTVVLHLDKPRISTPELTAGSVVLRR